MLGCSTLQNIQGKANAVRLQRPWTLDQRKQYYAEDAARHEHNAAAAKEGRELQHFWRSLYRPDQGMFCQAPADLQLGTLQKVGMGRRLNVQALCGVQESMHWLCYVNL